MPQFDMTITTGNILEIIGIVGGGLLFLQRVCARLNAIESKLEERMRQGAATDEKVEQIMTHLLAQQR